MKRNRPPDDEEELRKEARLVKDRIDALFSHCRPDERQVPLCNQAVWITDKRHAKIDQNIRLNPSFMVKYSTQFEYHYLEPYETLYCLDTSQLLVFHNNLPLSFAEAYQLLIENEVQYREYKVLQQLTRTGHICLKPSISYTKPINQIGVSQEEVSVHCCEKDKQKQSRDADIKELFSIDSINIPIQDVFKRLQELGPQAMCKPMKRSPGGEVPDISFDVYKRESFAKNKPQEKRPGRPDYFLIVCDLTSQAPPDADKLLYFSKLSELDSEKLLFALVDDDGSIFFAQYRQLDSLSPVRFTETLVP